MDPTANLTEQRAIQKRMANRKPSIETLAAAVTDLERLAELALALDEWLSNRGHFPAQWGGR